VFDQPRKLPLIRAVQEPRKALPPRDDQHRRIGRPTECPAAPIRQNKEKINRRHEQHGQQQHGERREDATHHDEPAAAAGKGAELLLNERIEAVAHGWYGLGVTKADTTQG
jgi:hypothetical protein